MLLSMRSFSYPLGCIGVGLRPIKECIYLSDSWAVALACSEPTTINQLRFSSNIKKKHTSSRSIDRAGHNRTIFWVVLSAWVGRLCSLLAQSAIRYSALHDLAGDEVGRTSMVMLDNRWRG